MANGTTLFFHKCDSYFCVLPKPAGVMLDSMSEAEGYKVKSGKWTICCGAMM